MSGGSSELQSWAVIVYEVVGEREKVGWRQKPPLRPRIQSTAYRAGDPCNLNDRQERRAQLDQRSALIGHSIRNPCPPRFRSLVASAYACDLKSPEWGHALSFGSCATDNPFHTQYF